MNKKFLKFLIILFLSNSILAQTEFNVRLYDENKIYSKDEIENFFQSKGN